MSTVTHTRFPIFALGCFTIILFSFSKPLHTEEATNNAPQDTTVYQYKGQFQMKNSCKSCHVKAVVQETANSRSLSIQLMGRRGGIKKFTIPATTISDTTIFENERFSMKQLPSGTIKGYLLSNEHSVAKLLLRKQQ